MSLESKLKTSEVARIRAEEEVERKKSEVLAERQKLVDHDRAAKEEEVSGR